MNDHCRPDVTWWSPGLGGSLADSRIRSGPANIRKFAEALPGGDGWYE
jgi:hypothetical protein